MRRTPVILEGECLLSLRPCFWRPGGCVVGETSVSFLLPSYIGKGEYDKRAYLKISFIMPQWQTERVLQNIGCAHFLGTLPHF